MIYDLTQPVFGCSVYPGDPAPEWIPKNRIENGDLYNLSAFSMCAHNGTHIDAPAHFIKDGKTVEQLELNKLFGLAFVADETGELGADDARKLLTKVEAACPEAGKRILFRGDAVITAEAAKVFAEAGVFLLGTESQSVGPLHAPMEVHLILLKEEIVLLEGIRLERVREGVYFLCCTPLLLNGAEGAPCRAVLSDSIIERADKTTLAGGMVSAKCETRGNGNS